MSLMDQQWCPASVQVTVLQARGLRIKGKSGTNDAYAVMQVGKEKYQTSVAEKSVAPVWKEEAAFDLPPSPSGGGGERGTLRVHVMHRALVGPDKLLGQAVISLLQLSEDTARNKTEWFKLLDKTGKADKDRGEVLLDIQFMRNNMTASMFDLSAAGKSRSRLGKLKDKVRGKKKESDTVSSVVQSFTQVLTDSEEEANGDGEPAAEKDEKKKKHKMKSLFSPKSNLQRNMSQSLSVLPANSSLSGSQSSGLNVESSEGKKKFKFMLHKRSGSSDSKDSSSGLQKHSSGEHSNMCINGSHVYCEEPQPRTSRIGSNFSLTSSGHGSMEDVPERQHSAWTEEEEETAEVENIQENVDEEEEEERMRVEEEKVRRQEELEKLAEEKRRREEEEKKRMEEEKVKREKEEKKRREEEREKQEEEERVRREEECKRLAEEKRKLEEEERRRIEEKRQKEEAEQIKMEEKRAQEERRKQEEEERVRREEERKLAEEKSRLEEEERKRVAEEKARKEEDERKRREEEKAEEERRRREEEERVRKEEEEFKRLAEEKRKLEEQERRRIAEEKVRKEEEERKRREEEKAEEERRRREEEERVRRQEEEFEKKRRLEEQERRQREEEERIREEERRQKEEERAKKEKEEYERLKLEEARKRVEAEEKERVRVEEERRRREEEAERVRREKEEKMRLEEQERRRIEEEEKRQREEQERIRKEEARRQEEEERARREKEVVEEKRRQEEKERKQREERIRQEEQEKIRMEEKRRQEEEERLRKEKMKRLAEEKKKQEEEETSRRLEEEKAERERETDKARQLEKEQKKRENQSRDGHEVAVESPAEVTSTNPFEDSYNPMEEDPKSSAQLDSSTGKVSNAQQRCHSVSSVEIKTISNDEKDLISVQREKRPAPQPPGRNQAEKQRDTDVSMRHQINKQSNDKDIKTASVLPQRSVQMIAPVSRSPTDTKSTQSLVQSSTTKGTTNAIQGKRPAPPRPRSVDDVPLSEQKVMTSIDNISADGPEAKQVQIVYGLNPFEDDEDENEAQDGNTGSLHWPPAVSQTESQTKIKSSKVARAPLPPAGTIITDNRAQVCEPESEAKTSVHAQKTPIQEIQPVVQNTVEEPGVKKEVPPAISRRLQPVKPLNPLEQQSVSVVQGQKDNKSTGILSEVQDKTKGNGAGLKGPYSQLTRDELISLVLKQEKQLSERDKKITELEQYIDNLLVRVMEEKPSILMSLSTMKKAV